MAIDPYVEFKAVQREGWGLFAPLETFTTVPAASLVTFARIAAGDRVLDVACGTGVVSVTAARAGASVRGLDLSPVLLQHARRNAELAEVEIVFDEGDVEALPYDDRSFDVVVSQFGHMFAPRPDVATAEMLRVLRPGGRIAFSTWPPDHLVGRLFDLVARHLPPPPGIAPPAAWGDPSVVRERLGDAVTDVHFDRDVMTIPALSPQHYRASMEATAAPVVKLVSAIASQPSRLREFRAELEALAGSYRTANVVRQHYLLTRAIKRSDELSG